MSAVCTRSATQDTGPQSKVVPAAGEPTRSALPSPGLRGTVEFDGSVVHDGDAPGPAPASLPFLTFDEAVRAHIRRALALASGRIEGKGGAADLLGLNPHTLRGKMRKLRIDWATFRAAVVR